MLLNEATAQERLNSPRNLANRFAINPTPSKVTEIEIGRAGRREGKIAIPVFLRTSAAILARSGEDQKDVAAAFGISRPVVGMIERGQIAGVDEKQVAKAIEPIRNLALEKLAGSLMGMKQEKMDTLGVKDLSTVAANMSRVVEKLTPKTEAQGNNININIFTPEPRKETAYETVSV